MIRLRHLWLNNSHQPREILQRRRRRRSNGFHVVVAAGTTRFNNNNMNVSLKNEVWLASRRPAVQLVH